MDSSPPETLHPEPLELDSIVLGTADDADRATAPSADEEVRSQAAALVRHVVRGSRAIEQRSSPRYAFPRLVQLVPIGPGGEPLEDETIVAVGKNISLGGMSVFHQRPLPYRHVLACIEIGHSGSFRIPLDLHWCRFTRLGWYESGGRFSATSGVETSALSGALLVPRDRPELLP